MKHTWKSVFTKLDIWNFSCYVQEKTLQVFVTVYWRITNTLADHTVNAIHK